MPEPNNGRRLGSAVVQNERGAVCLQWTPKAAAAVASLISVKSKTKRPFFFESLSKLYDNK